MWAIYFHITLTNQFNKRLKTAKFVIFRVIGSETNLKRNEASYAAFFQNRKFYGQSRDN